MSNTVTQIDAPQGSLARVIVPAKEVSIRRYDEFGKEIEPDIIIVRPFKFGQISTILKHAGVLFVYADELGDIDPLAAMEGASEEVFALLTLLIKRPRTWFDEIEMDEGTDLLAAMIEVNADFFIRHVLPALEPYLPAMDEEDEDEDYEMEEETENPESLTDGETPSSPTEELPAELDGIPEDVIPASMRIIGPDSSAS